MKKFVYFLMIIILVAGTLAIGQPCEAGQKQRQNRVGGCMAPVPRQGHHDRGDYNRVVPRDHHGHDRRDHDKHDHDRRAGYAAGALTAPQYYYLPPLEYHYTFIEAPDFMDWTCDRCGKYAGRTFRNPSGQFPAPIGHRCY